VDPVDGIGSWRTVDLANALLSGVSPTGSRYYPSFPYSSYVKMGLSDVRDLMTYLRTLPVVAGKPPPHDLAFPFHVRRFVGFWKLLYLDRRPMVSDPNRGEAWNRGQYLRLRFATCWSRLAILTQNAPLTRRGGANIDANPALLSQRLSRFALPIFLGVSRSLCLPASSLTASEVG
jgi:hypothetical protein